MCEQLNLPVLDDVENILDAYHHLGAIRAA